MTSETKRECHCIVKHPTSEEERKQIAKRLEYARVIGDTFGMRFCLMQLAQNCPAS